MLADQLHGDVAAALERDVGELVAHLLLEGDRDDLVFLLGAGPGHLESLGLIAGPRLGFGEEVLAGLVRRLGVHPQDELVERHHLDRRQVAPVERHARGQRRRKQVGQRYDDLVRVALGALHVEESLGPRAAALVDDDHSLFHEAVFGDDRLDDPRHLVGAAAGASRHDELHRLGRLPGVRHGCNRKRHSPRRYPNTLPETGIHDASF